MSKKKPVKKVVVKGNKEKRRKERVKPTTAKGRSQQRQKEEVPLLFDWANYRLMLIGIGLIAVGMILMLGGSMPSPDVWDENLIYSFRRTVLAPFCIVAGLIVEVFAIFKNS